jgi:hypothetical protein
MNQTKTDGGGMIELPKPSGRIRPFALEVAETSTATHQIPAGMAKNPPPVESTCGMQGPLRTLADWRGFLGGEEGTLEDPWGQKHRVSLRAYDGRKDNPMLIVGLGEYLPREEPSLTIEDGTVVGRAP